MKEEYRCSVINTCDDGYVSSNNQLTSVVHIKDVNKIDGICSENEFITKYIKANVLKRRKIWNRLFNKYSKMSSSTEIDFNEISHKYNNHISDKPSRFTCKTEYFIQYWINTGNIPIDYCDISNDENSSKMSNVETDELKHSDAGDKSSACTITLKFSNKESSSLSSVDTAAYILSNTNVTEKLKTAAIVEGAKQSPNSNNGISSIKNVSYFKTDINQESEDTDDIRLELPTSSSQSDGEKMKDTNLLNAQIPKIDLNNIEKNVGHQIDNEITQLCNLSLNNTVNRKKKLFTHRNSPVDLITTYQTNVKCPNLDDSLHPAFDYDFDETERTFICKDQEFPTIKKRRFQNSKRTMKNFNVEKSDIKNQLGSRKKKNQNIRNHQSGRKDNSTVLHSMLNSMKNTNPVVSLNRLSNDYIKCYLNRNVRVHVERLSESIIKTYTNRKFKNDSDLSKTDLDIQYVKDKIICNSVDSDISTIILYRCNGSVSSTENEEASVPEKSDDDVFYDAVESMSSSKDHYTKRNKHDKLHKSGNRKKASRAIHKPLPADSDKKEQRFLKTNKKIKPKQNNKQTIDTIKLDERVENSLNKSLNSSYQIISDDSDDSDSKLITKEFSSCSSSRLCNESKNVSLRFVNNDEQRKRKKPYRRKRRFQFQTFSSEVDSNSESDIVGNSGKSETLKSRTSFQDASYLSSSIKSNDTLEKTSPNEIVDNAKKTELETSKISKMFFGFDSDSSN